MPAASIPSIDISDPASASRQIEDACRDIGFLYVTGHGINPATIANMRAAVAGYFSLPLDVKLRQRVRKNNYRGYIPLGFFTANSGGRGGDHYEGFKLHLELPADDDIVKQCDLYGPNRWPALPNFREHVLAYWAACDRVAAVLLTALAGVLGVTPATLLGWFEKPLTNMTLLHYPSQEAGSDVYGIHPHKDTDALTILAPDPVGGLWVKSRGRDQWIAARSTGDALIVNIGDLLELWSGGYFVSTPHKVVNETGAARYSFPYFAVPRFDTVVAPLRPPQQGFARNGVHVGDVSREVWRTNWPDAVARDTGFDLGTLGD